MSSAAVVVALVSGALVLPVRARQTPQQFRGLARVVPVDVRVVDAAGRPVTDLTRDDFIVLDNGTPQIITQFATQVLPGGQLFTSRPLARDPASAATARVAEVNEAGRVFLIQIGRGRYTGPAKEIEAAITFVRDQLSDADRVGALVYNRATAFTSNRESVAGILERFRSSHELIEALLDQHFSGLQAAYGSPEIPLHIQTRIDALFQAPGISGAPVGTVESALGREVRATAEELLGAGVGDNRIGGLSDYGALRTAENLGMSFDEFIARGHQTIADFGNLHKAIAFLRHVDGEKHLLFLTPKGVYLPRAEFEEELGAIAADSRVAMHTIYTDGPVGPPPPTGRRTHATASFLQRFGQTAMVQGLRSMSRISGGNASAYQYSRDAFERIAATTEFQYVLGYVPTLERWDGAFRHIEVKLRRQGLTLHYRRSYRATETVEPIDPRTFLTSYRIAAAEASPTEINAGIRASVSQVDTTDSTAAGSTVSFDVVVAPTSRLGLVEREGRRVASVQLKAVVGDDKGRAIGEIAATLDLQLSAAAYEAFMRDGFTRRFQVPVKGRPRHLKVILYAYEADALGTASARLR